MVTDGLRDRAGTEQLLGANVGLGQGSIQRGAGERWFLELRVERGGDEMAVDAARKTRERRGPLLKRARLISAAGTPIQHHRANLEKIIVPGQGFGQTLPGWRRPRLS